MTLENDYRCRTVFSRFYPQPEWTETGLMLGAGTCLLRSHEVPAAEAGERLLAILSTLGLRDADRAVLGHVDAARKHWRGGDKALTQLRLAYAGLPTVDALGGFRAFLADHVLACGLSPAELRKELGFGDQTAVRKYSDAQSRVRAGSGRESGRGTSGDDPPVVEGRSIDAGGRARTAFLDDRRARDAETRSEDKAKETSGTQTIENEAAQGHPIPLLPTGPFGAPLPLVGPSGTGASRVDPKAGGAGGDDAVPPGGKTPFDDSERLCPEPAPEPGGHTKPTSKAYQEYVGRLVNPDEPPVPAGWAYGFPVPQTGKPYFIDHCRFSDGAFIEAKGRYAFLLRNDWKSEETAKDFIDQARLQLHLAQAYGGRAVEWWFQEKAAADFARDTFQNTDDLEDRILVKHVSFGM